MRAKHHKLQHRFAEFRRNGACLRRREESGLCRAHRLGALFIRVGQREMTETRSLGQGLLCRDLFARRLAMQKMNVRVQ